VSQKILGTLTAEQDYPQARGCVEKLRTKTCVFFNTIKAYLFEMAAALSLKTLLISLQKYQPEEELSW